MTEHLAKVLGRMGGDIGITLKVCGLLTLWEKVADERVEKHTRASKIRNRILYVTTSSPAWAQELSFLKKEIMEKFNRLAGGEVIRDIKFKSGGI